MSRSTGAHAAALIATPGGIVAALAVSVLPEPHGLLVGTGLACYLVFLAWPWLCVPAGILGGAIVASLLAGRDLPMIVMIHSGILLAGTLSLLTRWLVVPSRHRRRPTAADSLMLILVAAIVLGAGYGLARGNAPYLVMVAAYQLAVVPAYFFLTSATLPTQHAVKIAGVTFVGALVIVGLAQLAAPATPHHDLGLFSALVLVPLLACASSMSGWRRAGLLAVCAVLAAHVMLSEYRTVWVASGLAVLVLLVRGSARVRTTTGAALAVGGLVVMGGAVLHAGISGRWAEITGGLADSPGYRQAESILGLRVLSEHPLLGLGLGQTLPDAYVEGLGVTDVGPAYHAYWVLVLANLGLLGLLAVLAPLLLAVRVGLSDRSGPAFGFAALLGGFLVSATFASPTDGHWELGLLAALTLLAATWRDRATRSDNLSTQRNQPCLLARGSTRRIPLPA